MIASSMGFSPKYYLETCFARAAFKFEFSNKYAIGLVIFKIVVVVVVKSVFPIISDRKRAYKLA